MQIIDGYCGIPNIYADDIGEYHISIYGAEDYVLAVGEQLGYELVSNNEIRIKDGIFITQGRRGIMKKGTAESCVIENGTQAENRNDLIVIEYAKDETTQIESHTLKVVKGTPGETAGDPEIITGDIPGGDVIHQMPLYRVRLEGLNVVAVEQLFKIGTIAPETVDPMTTTEEGFAADAKLTGDALRELSANLDEVLSHLRQQIVSDSGTYTTPTIRTNSAYNAIIAFKQPFNSVPTVKCSVIGMIFPANVSMSNIVPTEAGFSVNVRNTATDSGQDQAIKITWLAQAKQLT